MTIELAVTGVSLLTQLIAVLLAVRLIRLTGRRSAGLVIVVAVLLMAFRRAISLYRLLTGGPVKVDLVAEVVALVIAVMILVGILYLTRIILALKVSTADLATSEERYRTLADASFEGIAVTEAGRLVDLSEQFAAMLGHARGELLGRPMTDFVAPEDLARVRAVISSPGEPAYECRLLRKDGTQIVVECRARNFTLKGRETRLTALRDVTERYSTQESLQKTSELLGAIVRCSPLAVICIDAAGKVMMWNPAAEQLFGWSEAETLGKQNPIVPQEKLEEYLGLRERVRGGKAYASLVLERQRKDGTRLTLNASSAPLGDAAGGVIGLVGVFEDITARRRVERELAEREALLEQIMDTSSVGIGLVDMDGRFTHANRSMARLFGCGMEEFLGSDYVDHVHPAARDDSRRSMLALLRSEVLSVDLDRRYWRKDGTEFWGHLTCNRFYDSQGSSVGLIGAISDITERKEAEQRLVESETMLRLSQRVASVGHYVFDIVAGTWTSSGVMDEIFGIGPDYVRSVAGWLNIIHAGERSEMAAYLANHVLGERTPFDRDYRIARVSDGAVRWVHGEGRLEAGPDGSLVRMFGTIQDITGRKQAEEALRESEERFRLAMKGATDGLWDWNLATDEVYYSPRWKSMLGYAPDELENSLETWKRLVHPDDRERVLALVRDLLEDRSERFDVEFRMRHKDGGVRHILSRAFLSVNAESGVKRLVGTHVDITERHQLEEERLKTQKLESIGTLAGGIAHDFNNLLQGVFGYISMAKLTHARKEKSLAMLEQAEQALHLSVNLTSQLLTFSKGGQPVKTRVALAPIVENAAKFALSGSRSDFRLAAESGLWRVDADAGQIGQVVQNIVLNADQAMPLGGRVCIGARNVPSGSAELPAGLGGGDFVRIAIADNGVGIPERYLTKIFDPYFTTKEKGSGLGLATSYSIIRNHGGRIEVSSAVDKGTTFLIFLPALPDAVAEREQTAPASSFRAGRFLVMDDEEIVRVVAGELLRELGHEVEFAEHGAMALDKYRAASDAGRPFDAVILDLTIRGGMGGRETLKRLQESDPAVKAIVSSGYSDDAIVANHATSGFRSFLKKPYDLEELRRTLGAVLS